ncbi:MAG: tetratricopeptide repeat protein, partial [Alphaproteobacteria bacterium]|nr:tetratricopeptide repeat protein [Alphaproteobacteria bacterium]
MTVQLTVPPAAGPAPLGLPPEIVAAFAQGRLEDADHLAVSILARMPADPALLNLLGVIRIARGLPQEARRPLAFAAILAPQAAPPASNLAMIFLAVGGDDAALRWARRARMLDSSQPDIHATEASAERAAGNLDRAECALRRALALAPAIPDFLGNTGNLWFDRERLSQARRFYRRALAVSPGSGNPRFQLACIDLCEGNVERGWRGYEARFV